jgi:hypothetical protein
MVEEHCPLGCLSVTVTLLAWSVIEQGTARRERERERD